MEFWRQFEQELLGGQFRLDKYVCPFETGALFLTQLSGGQEQRAAVKVIAASGPLAQSLAASWKLAKGLQHPNLVQVYATDSTSLGGLRIVYAVMDHTDQTLAKILEERCLTGEEAHELLLCSAQALEFLHERGVIHSHLTPSAIVAVDSSTKLSVDHLKLSGQLAEVTPAGDVAALAATVCQALTGVFPPPGDATFASSLPAPFSEILPPFLDTGGKARATARDLITALGANVSGKKGRLVFRRPSIKAVGLGSRKIRLASATFAYAGVALVSCAIWLASIVAEVSHRSDRGSQKPGPDPTNVSAAPGEGQRLRRITPQDGLPGAVTPPSAPASWRVVLFKDSDIAKANRKADAINELWPDLKAAVFSPTGAAPFEVVAGGSMERKGALKLVKRLRASGFPDASLAKTMPR